jgi:hypothetical protein
VTPKLNRRRALVVLGKIDQILSCEQHAEQERDRYFVELGRYLCETRAGQYWRIDNLKSFDEFLEKKFPQSRRKAYYLMAVHERLTRVPKKDLEQLGWTKARELVRVARRDGQSFDCAPWVHKASEMPREKFKREVERYVTGKDSEPSDLIDFKVYRSQVRVIEDTLEKASLMLGGDKARGYCLEMICADFLAGVGLEVRDSDLMLVALSRLFEMLPPVQKDIFAQRLKKASMRSRSKGTWLRLDAASYKALCQAVLKRDGWRCQSCGSASDLQIHHICRRSALGSDIEENRVTLCALCHGELHNLKYEQYP